MLAFVSYNKADKLVAREIALYLKASSVEVWYDEWQVEAGESVPGRIEDGLGRCTHFVILWSQHSSRSGWVSRERHSTIAHAIETGTPRVVPIRLDSTPLPPLLRDFRYVRYSGGSQADLRCLITEILGKAPGERFLKSVVKKYHELISDPGKAETLGLRACPRCGSQDLEPYEDAEVDIDYNDGEATPFATMIPSVRCRECGWSRRQDDPEIGG